MVDLSNLTDKQNLYLTQLSYKSDVLNDTYNGMKLSDIVDSVPDNDTKTLLRELCDIGLGELTVKEVGNDPVTGFGAIAFTDTAGNTGFSYRGTDGIKPESLNDWLDNMVACGTGTSPQSNQAEQFFNTYKDLSGNNYLYGHSKGGNLAEFVYVNDYSHIKEIHLLNPQPLNPYSLTAEQRKAICSDSVDIVVVVGDYVWFLGRLPSYGNIRFAEGNGSNPHTFDALRGQFNSDDSIIQSKQPWYEYAAYFAITGMTSNIQRSGAGLQLVHNCTVCIVDYVRNELIPSAVEFMNRVVDKLEKLGEDIKAFASELKEFLSSTINKVKAWCENNLKPGYRYATQNPQITVDTYKLESYAQRLRYVNRRIARIDGRLDALYWRVGLLDLWNLMRADILTGYSVRLSRAAAYLEATAADMDSVEKELLNSI